MLKKNSTNQLKIGVFLSYLQIGLNMIVQLAYTPIMIRLLGKSEYGLYNLVGSVVSYLSLFSMGFTGAYLRFSTIKRKSGDRNEIASFNGMFLSLFLVMGVVALLCGGVLSLHCNTILGTNLTEQELSTARVLMVILVINIALTFPSSVFNSMITAEEQFLFQKLVTIIGTILNPLIVLPLLIEGKGSVAVVLVTTCITFLQLIVNIYYCIFRLKTPIRFRNYDWKILKEMGIFSFFLFLNMIIDQINWTVDKLILGNVIGTKAVAEYGVGAQINTMTISFSTAISSVFSPRINKIAVYSENREKNFDELFIKVGRIQFMILALITSGFVFFGKYFVQNIYAGKEYVDSYYVALLLIIPGVVPLIQNIGIEIQRAVNKHYFRSIIYFFMAFVNVVISIFLAKRWGTIGAATGTAISLLVMNGLVMNLYYAKGIGLDICRFWKNIGKLLLSICIPLLLGSILNRTVKRLGILPYLGLIMLYTIVYCLFLYRYGMNDYEKGIIRNIIRKLRGKRKIEGSR
ncbi:lipopolysaccharide biosynthesis protein [Eubacterium sp. MSJ-33]|uniref:lipopolysaccharide biosynthesis protein n=1 Tax=Eubacterium sp. MSJ-33 TaxID=2841528 RepID=UPI001C7579C1|nr:oligosaccharide flippase family protein [Eubacterium sp. MSJ-33]QWT54145.1 oligosaccharide flippase family protein [Eubacterium sp. MSJ-33]